MSEPVDQAQLFAALDELAAAGLIEWRREDGGAFSTQILKPAVEVNLDPLTPLAVRVYLELDRTRKRLMAGCN